MSQELDEIYEKICFLTGEKLSAGAEKEKEVLKSLKVLEKKLEANKKQEEENSKRIDEILKVLVSLANLKYDKKVKISNKKSQFDALALGINMLGEELKASTISLQEKEVLLKELHHRVKNNLQVISSILNLQSSFIKDENVLNIFRESQNRIKSMAFIHESLYQTKDFSNINFSEYVVSLSQNLIHSYANFEKEIELKLDVQNVFLNLDLAIPCGLIINEIVSNALKYAFVGLKEGVIDIKMCVKDDDLKLIIGDNGIGLPEKIDYRNTESLGLQLVVALVEQLNGSVQINSNQGTVYTIKFKQNQIKNRI